MMDSISISELQRQGQKAFQGSSATQIVLANNKKSGLIFNKEALEVLEASGLLEEIEDQLLGYHMGVTHEKDDFVELEAIKNAL
jgi:hypothetical protein